PAVFRSGCLVNGHPVCEALLGPGDQVVVGRGQRFVVESPLVRVPARPVAREYPAEPAPGDFDAPAGGSWRHLPWVLLAAAMIAGILALLLTWGGGAMTRAFNFSAGPAALPEPALPPAPGHRLGPRGTGASG